MNTPIYSLYKRLLQTHGNPKEIWPQWCASDKNEQLRQLISLGAILTQRTSWINAEKALFNLKAANLLDFTKVQKANIDKLTDCVRVAGFYTTKPKRLQALCSFVLNNYGNLTHMLSQDLTLLREQLLTVYGIGPETADTILLYALDKPSFVIDAYTTNFVQKYNLTDKLDYYSLKKFFEESLPQDVEIYQNYHVLIIVDQKGKKDSFMKEI